MLHTPFPHVCETSPVKNDNFHPIYLLHLPWWIRTVSDFVLFGKLIHPTLGLICSFYSSGQEFAAGFLQIPPCDGHPCLKLTLPTVKARSGFSPYSYRPCRANTKKPLQDVNLQGLAVLRSGTSYTTKIILKPL